MTTIAAAALSDVDLLIVGGALASSQLLPDPGDAALPLGLVSYAVALAALLSHAVRAARAPPRRQMPRLSILELSTLLAVATIVWIGLVPRRAFELSAAHCTGRCRRLLRPGWFAGLPRDASDDQLRPFREQLPLLLVLAAAHVVSGRVTRRRLASDLAFSAAALFFLHGPGALLVLALANTTKNERRHTRRCFFDVLLFRRLYDRIILRELVLSSSSSSSSSNAVVVVVVCCVVCDDLTN